MAKPKGIHRSNITKGATVKVPKGKGKAGGLKKLKIGGMG